ncbi:hypothetical protein HDV00_000526 [Rhizophlyctis rosea]|nr:hypothetical protein HDV00_000526 [Rhizophlyctis rosea]
MAGKLNDDIIITILSLTPVPALLRCEQTCSSWSRTIRSRTTEVWKPKLIDTFPEGCLPVRYGMESWRDLVLDIWAWETIGDAATYSGEWGNPTAEVVDAECPEPGTFVRLFEKGKKRFVRDLVEAYDQHGFKRVKGSFVDGRVLIMKSPDYRSDENKSAFSMLFDGETITLPPLPTNLVYAHYTRPSDVLLSRTPDTDTFHFHHTKPLSTSTDTRTTPPLPSVQVTQTFRHRAAMTGSVAFLKRESDNPEAISVAVIHSFSTTTKPTILHLPAGARFTPPTAYDESFFVHISHNTSDTHASNTHFTMHLMRLSDGRTLKIVPFYSKEYTTPIKLHLTRSHILVQSLLSPPAKKPIAHKTVRVFRLRDLAEVGNFRKPEGMHYMGWVGSGNDGGVSGWSSGWGDDEWPIVFDVRRRKWQKVVGTKGVQDGRARHVVRVREWEVDWNEKRTGGDAVEKFYWKELTTGVGSGNDDPWAGGWGS